MSLYGLAPWVLLQLFEGSTGVQMPNLVHLAAIFVPQSGKPPVAFCVICSTRLNTS